VPLAIAQVSPYPWEQAHEVNAYVDELSSRLAGRGHRVLVLAPSRSPELVRESRKRIRSGELFTGDGPQVLAVGELLPTLAPRRAIPSLPVDIARTIEELLETADLDVVHVHEPWAPSASSTALRHSRALNVGTFHLPAERVLSTQVARRFVELFFGRLDARLASFAATAELLNRSFPATYEIVRPGATVLHRDPSDGPVHIAFCALEERAALRVFLRALRRLPADLDWRATVFAPGGHVPASATRVKLRERVEIVTEEDATIDSVLADADVLVAASSGIAPAPGLVLRALGAGAVPVVSRLPAYEEVVADGDAGLVFEASDVDVLAAQLERVVADADLRRRLHDAGDPLRAQLSWDRVTDDIEAVYDRQIARRHDGRSNPAVAKRLEQRREIDVDLHMHTDHSHDCATPVEALLAAARKEGLGAIAVTDHNEISGALDAAAKAADYGVKVIVAEEVKTAEQGEVIGLFIKEKIPRGMTLQETIAEIKRQGGLVYVPHPFDRLHAIPDYEHLLDVVEDIDAIEVFNPRIALPAFNEEAVRFAAKYRIVGGAGSDSHVAQGLGSVRIKMRDFDGPEEFLESLRQADIVARPSALYYAGVQALKFLQTKATPPGARQAARERRVRKATRNL
jgi:predicted metal-dependent phosphoesterase TrpH/glycosyltransferase involved in cell wall biosynthesis